MRTTFLVSGLWILATSGCADVDMNLDREGFESESELTMLIYENPTPCCKPHCPTHFVVDREGNVEPIHLFAGGPDGAPEMTEEGLLLRGAVEKVVVDGVALNALHVIREVGAPVRYLPYELKAPCKAIGCAQYGLLTEDHEDLFVESLAVEPMRLGEGDHDGIMDAFARGDFVVSAWPTLREEEHAPSRTRAFVTSLVEEVTQYRAVHTGIQCFTDPCPYWDIYDERGELVGQAADVDFRVLQETDKREAQLEEAVASGRMVRGWLLTGSWAPHETGTVLYVTHPRVD